MVYANVNPWAPILASPAVQQALARALEKLPELLERKIAGERKVLGWTTLATFLWGGVLALAVLAATWWLVASHIMSPESGTFVFGAIIGASFTFIRDIFPKGPD